MRAAVITMPGGGLTVRDHPAPVAGAGEVLVDIEAAPITPLDLLCASGTSYFGVPKTPYVPGTQGVGAIDGRAVWFLATAGMRPGDGSMARAAAVAERDVVTLPDDVDPPLVAALGLSAIAARMALIWRGELEEGEQVIVLGAGGAAGQAAVQIARARGARRVIGAARSAMGRERAIRAGADAVVALDSDDVAKLTRRFEAACDGPADLVLDPLFGPPAAAAAAVLRLGGRLVNFGASAGETCPLTSSTLRSRQLRILGYTNLELSPEQRAEALLAILDQASRGTLAVDYETVALEDAPDAWDRQAAGVLARRVVVLPRASKPRAAAATSPSVTAKE